MREIKFRAFDKENKEMLYVSTLFLEGQFGGEGFGVSNTPYRNIDPETIMQYTELKDKNGVEIYEGDIVLFNEETYEVKWFDGAYVIKSKNSIRGITLLVNSYSEAYRLKVIGNIYENPELLEK